MDAFCALAGFHRAPITCAFPSEPLRTRSSLTAVGRFAETLGILDQFRTVAGESVSANCRIPTSSGPPLLIHAP